MRDRPLKRVMLVVDGLEEEYSRQASEACKDLGLEVVPQDESQFDLWIVCSGGDSNFPIGDTFETSQRPVFFFIRRSTSARAGVKPRGFPCDFFVSAAELGDSIKRSVDKFVGKRSRDENDNRVQKIAVRVLNVFLSSPGDVAEFRQDVPRVIWELNQDLVVGNGLFLRLHLWEDLPPWVGTRDESPQDYINTAIPMSEIDIYVGIMWHRFGTPTPRAGSGTADEFEEALRCKQSRGIPRIAFYRCDMRYPPSKIDASQLRRVKAFFKRLTSHAIIRTFDSQEKFCSQLQRDLKTIALELG